MKDTWGKPDPKPEKQDKKKPVKSIASLLKKMRKNEDRDKAKKELDEVFSIFIRQRGMNEQGITRCFTCGKFDYWKKLQCGHYWGRKEIGTRWDEINCQTQCFSCNCKKEGNKPAFTLNLIKKYGEGILSKLEINKNRVVKTGAFEMNLQINHYKSLIK